MCGRVSQEFPRAEHQCPAPARDASYARLRSGLCPFQLGSGAVSGVPSRRWEARGRDGVGAGSGGRKTGMWREYRGEGGLERCPCTARSVFPSCCIHCFGGGAGRGRGGREAQSGGPAAGASVQRLRPRAALPGPPLGGGAGGGGGGARREGQCAARPPSARGLERSARPVGLRAGFPRPWAVPPQPLAGPWRPTVSALRPWRPRVGGRGVRGWGVLLVPTPAFMPGSRTSGRGPPSPPGGPLLLCPSPFATRQDLRRAGGPGSQLGRAVAEGRAPGTEMEGMPRGSGACRLSPSGTVPSGPEPAFPELCHQRAASFGRCEVKVRLEFWVGCARLPSGKRVARLRGCSGGPHSSHVPSGRVRAGQRPHLVVRDSECH